MYAVIDLGGTNTSIVTHDAPGAPHFTPRCRFPTEQNYELQLKRLLAAVTGLRRLQGIAMAIGAQLTPDGLTIAESWTMPAYTGRSIVSDVAAASGLPVRAANDNVIVALQVETADCIRNIDAIAAVPGVDLLFLGQNDLCMSLGLYEKYQFPDMYFSDELRDATDRLRAAAAKNDVILGLFLFGTDRVGEFLEKGFPFISVGNDLHHVLTQAGTYVGNVETISQDKGRQPWQRRATALF